MTDERLLAIYTAERDEIKRRLAWLGVKSTGSERLERRKAALDTLIDTLQRQGA